VLGLEKESGIRILSGSAVTLLMRSGHGTVGSVKAGRHTCCEGVGEVTRMAVEDPCTKWVEPGFAGVLVGIVRVEQLNWAALSVREWTCASAVECGVVEAASLGV